MNKLQEGIIRLKKEKQAIILAHNYQKPEIQDIADFIGDSIELCRKAHQTRARMIVFCGVDFMAQSAVMAQMLPPDYLKFWQQRHPGVPSVLYVNTLGEAKALCDVCCTSANAVKIVEKMPEKKILFGPDSHLAAYVAKETGKEIIPVPSHGYCPVHVLFEKEDLLKLKAMHPEAILMIHPECPMEAIQMADFIGSTSQMGHFVEQTDAKTFIVGTEIGLIHRLKKENPKKEFIPANPEAICTAMKAITLVKAAQQSLEKMVEIVK